MAIELPDAYEDPYHGLGPADEGPDELEDVQDRGPVFHAAYDGECGCGAEFTAGDRVQYVDGELTALECCGEWDA